MIVTLQGMGLGMSNKEGYGLADNDDSDIAVLRD
jgi:hypothetical protein